MKTQRKVVVYLLTAIGVGACGVGVSPEGRDSLSQARQAVAGANGPLPAALEVPAGNHRAFELQGVGVQIYACKAVGAGFGWVFQAPDATLLEPNDDVAGHHFAGPTWQSTDGSTVKGAKRASVTVDATAIPWLLLQAVAHTGDGVMSNITWVQRLDTSAGIAPASGCDASAVGQKANVAYTAHYVFFVSDGTQGNEFQGATDAPPIDDGP